MDPRRLRTRLVHGGFARHLYKYRAIPPASDTEGRRRFESLLLDNQLWLSKFADFNDPFDGKADYEVPFRGHELRTTLERRVRQLMGLRSQAAKKFVTTNMVAHPELLEVMLRENHDRILNTVGICSFAATHNNPLMWAHYADEHKGLCIKFCMAHDVANLISHPVDYCDRYPVIRNSFEPGEKRNDLAPLLRKSRHWSYEEEWRIVSVERAGTPLAFEPRAMTGVMLGIRCSDDNRAYVQSLMEQRKQRYDVAPMLYQGKPARRQYRVKFWEVL